MSIIKNVFKCFFSISAVNGKRLFFDTLMSSSNENAAVTVKNV